MKFKRKKRSAFLKGLGLTLALSLAVFSTPTDAFVVSASGYTDVGDVNVLTIGTIGENVSTVVNKGETYQIPTAYIGDANGVVIGDASQINQVIGTLGADDVTLKASSVKVTYSAIEFSENVDATHKVSVSGTGAATKRSFVADMVGTYTITYSYTYEVDSREYTNEYSLNVDCQFTTASINFESNEKNFIPKIYDLSQGAKDIVLPKITIKDEDGEDIDEDDIEYVKALPAIIPANETHNFVVVSVKGGHDAGKSLTDSEFELAADGTMTIKKETISADNGEYGAGKYTITYAYYLNKNFVVSTTKTMEVKPENYEDYKLKAELSSDWVDNGQTGVESKLPSLNGLVGEEQVDIFYTVKVLFKGKDDASYAAINGTTNAKYAEIVDANGILKDSSKFKPLEDGSYNFVYTAYDAYYDWADETNTNNKKHMDTIGDLTYLFKNVKDTTAPTPILYDASTDSKEDASQKFKSRSNANAVIVYAIDMEDNIEADEEHKSTLSRKIMTSETVSKLEIKDYNDKNLVFNYRSTGTDASSHLNAYENLLANNYLIRKEAGAIANNTEMLTWLKAHGYLIVVDNANAEHIYEIFDEENFFNDKEGVDTTDDDTRKETAIAWLKGESSKASGFGYLNADQTFGATSTDNGMGIGQYYVHYIAKDASGNEKDVSKSIYIGSYNDDQLPTLKFSTTLADTYMPTSTISFDAPTATDNFDSNMLVKTYYRYLDGTTALVVEEDGEVVSTNDTVDLWDDITGVKVDGKDLDETYAAFKADAASYIDITDKTASSYTINVSKDYKNNATLRNAADLKLQILVFAYDDAGNANVYGQEIKINNVVDNYAPYLKAVEVGETDYQQGAEIELPTIKVQDDKPAYLSAQVKVLYNDEKTVANYDAQILSINGLTYTYDAGAFTASRAGKYTASVAVKDGANNTIVVFTRYNVSSRVVVEDPTFNVSMSNKTIEIDSDETVELETPTVNISLDGSITYDVFADAAPAQKAEYEANNTYIVRGVDKNGKATNYFTNYNADDFVEVNKDYALKYTVNVEIYDCGTFEFVEEHYDTTTNQYVDGNYYTFENNTFDGQVYVEDGVYYVNDISNGVEYTVSKNDADEIQVYEGNDQITNLTGTILEGFVDTLFEKLKTYSLSSDIFTIKVQDTTKPILKLEQDYPKVADTSANSITIYGIRTEAAKSAIDVNKSKVVVSWKLADGTSDSKTYSKAEAFDNQNLAFKTKNGDVIDGTYTVTYTVYDENGNYTTQAYDIAVGDNEAPVVTDTIEIKSSYKKTDALVVDLDDISAYDTNLSDAWKTSTEDRDLEKGIVNKYLKITLTNSSTGDNVKIADITGNKITFEKYENVGSYTLTIEVEDMVGWKGTKTESIEVSENASNAVSTYKVVGTILIVVSVMILAGVIVYFVVSKVKLDKELKK